MNIYTYHPTYTNLAWTSCIQIFLTFLHRLYPFVSLDSVYVSLQVLLIQHACGLLKNEKINNCYINAHWHVILQYTIEHHISCHTIVPYHTIHSFYTTHRIIPYHTCMYPIMSYNILCMFYHIYHTKHAIQYHNILYCRIPYHTTPHHTNVLYQETVGLINTKQKSHKSFRSKREGV